MAKFSVNKGADRPAEVIGVKGFAYLKILALVAVVGLVVVSVLIPFLPFKSYYGYGTYLLSLVVTHGILSSRSKKYGEHGVVREAARRQAPRTITVRNSEVYRQLRKR